MANRRMFSKKITDTDEFLDMPASTQALYFHMNMHADDDGFVGNPKTIKRMVGASEDDLKLLIAKRYLICFQSGVVLITDWKVHNYIRKDTYTPTIYTDEMAQITQKQNGKYELMRVCNEPVDGHVTGKYTKVLQGSNGLVDAGKDRLGKDNKVIYSAEKSKPNKKRQAKPDNLAPLRKKVIAYLNEKLHTRYQPNSFTTKRNIDARVHENNYKFEDFKKAIDNKIADWGNDPKMSKYLRPGTLFGPKMEGYVNEKVKTATSSFDADSFFNDDSDPTAGVDVSDLPF